MKHIHILYIAIVAFMVMGCARELATDVPGEYMAKETVRTIVPGQAIIQFDDDMIELIASPSLLTSFTLNILKN